VGNGPSITDKAGGKRQDRLPTFPRFDAAKVVMLSFCSSRLSFEFPLFVALSSSFLIHQLGGVLGANAALNDTAIRGARPR
jgi:hypothetical protein